MNKASWMPRLAAILCFNLSALALADEAALGSPDELRAKLAQLSPAEQCSWFGQNMKQQQLNKASDAQLQAILQALSGLRYGQVTVIVQDGRVMQIDRTDRFRLPTNDPVVPGRRES